KGLMADKKLLLDIYGYYGIYSDFITRTLVAQSVNGNINVFTNPATVRANLSNPALATTYSVPTNVKGDVTTYGYGISLTYALPSNFAVSANTTSDRLEGVPDGFTASFNAPKYRAGASITNTGFGFQNRLGFDITYRWQDEVTFQSDFATGQLPAYHTLDAQLSYRFPVEKVMLKVGGTNLLNQYYRNGFGNATIGGLYYVSIGYNL
ncbi:MAG: TonB-dependent receptor, partial [Ginsengibacter sp.]